MASIENNNKKSITPAKTAKVTSKTTSTKANANKNETTSKTAVNAKKTSTTKTTASALKKAASATTASKKTASMSTASTAKTSTKKTSTPKSTIAKKPKEAPIVLNDTFDFNDLAIDDILTSINEEDVKPSSTDDELLIIDDSISNEIAKDFTVEINDISSNLSTDENLISSDIDFSSNNNSDSDLVSSASEDSIDIVNINDNNTTKDDTSDNSSESSTENLDIAKDVKMEKKSTKKSKEHKEGKTKEEKVDNNSDKTERKEIKTNSKSKKSRIAAILLDMGFLLSVALCVLVILFLVQTKKDINHTPTFFNLQYVNVKVSNTAQSFNKTAIKTLTNQDLDTGKMYTIQISNNDINQIKANDKVVIAKGLNNNKSYTIAKFVKKDLNNKVKVAVYNTTTKNYDEYSVDKAKLIGAFDKISPLSSIVYIFTEELNVGIIYALVPLMIMIILAFALGFLLPKSKTVIIETVNEKTNDANTKEKSKSKEKETEVQTKKDEAPKSSPNSIANIPTISNLAPLDLSTQQNSNYFTSVSASGTDLYMKISKFNDSIRELQETGAVDMDIIRVNMIGNTDFDKLLTLPRKDVRSIPIESVIEYANKLLDINCIKRNGKLNWTYKYKNKTVLILREDSQEGYKMSFKTYPDAADKLNSVYMALEDSNFPAGPCWYMLNNLRNVPFDVIKWLIDESYRISKLQQIRTDLLSMEKHLRELIDVENLKTSLKLYTEVNVFDKFVTIMQKKSDNLKECLLDNSYTEFDINDYNKEIYFPTETTERVVSFLLSKKCSEQLASAISNDFMDIYYEVFQIAKQHANEATNANKTSVIIKKKR